MKKITLCFFMMVLPLLGFSQINEGFEGASFPPTTPGNWLVTNNGVGTGVEWTETTNAPFVHSGNKAAIIGRENIGATNTSEDWLITSQVTMPSNGQLRFWTRQVFVGPNGSIYQIRVSTNADQTNLGAYNIVQTWTETSLNTTYNVYEEKLVDLSAYTPGTQVYIAFVKVNTQPAGTTSGDQWIIDDVNLVQQCLDPSILSVGAITVSTAVLNWQNNGSATMWDIYYNQQADSTVPTVATTPMFNDVTTNPFTATGLAGGTAYKFWVRAVCSGGVVSNWVGPFNFTTKPAGTDCTGPIVISGLPYTHTGNTNDYGDDFDTSQGTGCAGGTTNYLQGPEVFYSFTPTVSGNITISMTPTAVSSSLYVYNGCANVGVSCLAGAADTTANPRNIATLAVTAGQTYIIVISSSSSPAGGIPYTLIIQEKFCNPPTGGTTNTPTTNSIQMSWNGPTGATAWQVTVQAPGAGVPVTPGPLTETATVNTNFVFGGLAQATAYEYWVRAECGGGLYSPWAGPYRFNTSICEPVDRCNYVIRMTDSGGNGWEGARVEIRQNGIVVGTVGSTFNTGFGPVTSPQIALCQNLPFEVYWTLPGNAPAQVGFSVVNNFNQILFTKPPGTGSASTTTPLYSTSFSCSTPACLPPTTISDNTPTTQGTTVAWTANGGSAWDIYVVPFGSPAPTAASTPTFPGVTTNPFLVTGLQPNTQYQYYIRTSCSSTSASIWTGPGDFTTLPTCSRPLSLTFSNVTASSAVLNWTQPLNPDGSLANQWQVILLPCGSPVPDATTPGWVTINSKPFTALGLSPLTCYDYYVRAVCSPTDLSPISSPQTFETPDINDECVNSKLVPVNQNTHCIQTTLGSLQGATASIQAPAPCLDAAADDDDVWFHFTATATTHYISLHKPALTGGTMPDYANEEVTGLSYALYSGSDCGNLTPVTCHQGIGGSMNTGLTIGQTYKIRVFSTAATFSLKFEVCVGTKVVYCESAVPLCVVDDIVIRNDVGVPSLPNPIDGSATANVGCLGSAPAPTFYYLTIPQNGNYTYHIVQGTSATNTPNLDVDYATWGPFPDVATACSSVSVNNVRGGGQTVGCSFSGLPQEDFAFPNAIAGDVYVIMVTNYTAQGLPGMRGYIKITKTSGPEMLECCPYTNISYSSNFYCKDDPNPSPILGQAASLGTFSASPNTLVIDPITGVVDLAASPVGTYLITSYLPTTDPECNPSSSTWTITITNPPSAAIVYSATDFCTTDTTTQTVTQTGTTGGYYLPVPNLGLSINPVTGAFTPSTSTPGTYMVYYRIPASGGCDLYEVSTTVVINNPAVADFTYGTAPYCQNGGTVLPTFTGGGIAGTFSSSAGLVINSSTGEIDLASSTVGTYTVTNEIAASGGCGMVTANAVITITALPIATFNYITANHCQSEGTVLPTFVGGGIAGTFSSSTGLVINPTTGEIDLASSTAGTYTVYNTFVAANGCPQVQESFVINVYANPVAAISSSDLDNTICVGESATLTVTPTNFAVGDATYVWLLNNGVIPNATSHQYNPTQSGLYEVQITLNGCTNVTPITTNFTVNFVPQATIDGTNLVKCVNEVSVITVTPINYTVANPVTYSWTLDGNLLPDTTSSISYDDYGIYMVTITNQGCSNSYSITVSPDTTEIPINAVGDCQGPNYILTASPINGSFDTANVVYEWTNSNGDIVGTNQNTFNVSQYVQVNNISSGSFPLTFTVKVTTSPDGCTDNQDFVVVSSNCTIPKGISPNGDGKNDSFDLRGLGVKQLSIFNRYGTKVYSYSNYTDQWHGQTDKGDELPVGTYYFVYELNDGQNNSGWIYINK